MPSTATTKESNIHPERDIQLILPGFWRRFCARLLDSGLFLALFFGLFLISFPLVLQSNGLDLFQDTTQFEECLENNMLEKGCQKILDLEYLTFGIMGLVSTLIYTLYVVLMTSFKPQATLGKLALGIQVIRRRGGKLGLLQALVREILIILYLTSVFATALYEPLTGLQTVATVALLIDILKISFSPFGFAYHDDLAISMVVMKVKLDKNQKII